MGVGLCFYGFLIKSSYFGPYLVVALQNKVFKYVVSELDRDILKIVEQFLAIVLLLFKLYTCETRIIIGASLSEPHHMRSTVKSVFLLA